MNTVTHIASLAPRSDDDLPGGGYLDDAALITVLDREPDAVKRVARSRGPQVAAVAATT